MPLAIKWYESLIKITSPTTSVDAQELHDFVENQMASPEGLLYGDIIQPEGKIEDPVNPGIFSQIIIVLNSPWQIQFWGGSGYTRIYGGKLVGGLNDEVVKATGTAGDVTVLESPVDGLTVMSGSAVTEQDKLDIADRVWDELGDNHHLVGSLGENMQDHSEMLGGLEERLQIIAEQVEFVRDVDAGRWKIVNNQMVFYKEDNITEVARFDLLDSDGEPADGDVFERVRA